MDNRSHSVRVLVRPPPAPAPAAVASSASIATSLEPATPTQNGVVVVGFIGNRQDDVAHIINKIIDSNVFGSGNLDTSFRFEDPEIARWFERRKLSFYHHEEKGILYVQFSPACFISVSEDQELGDLQGLLFMFSVCHVIILIQEGSRFDTQLLQKFRVVQAAKHAITSYFRSQNFPPIASRQRSSASARMSTSGASPNNPSPGKGRGRNGSTITLMSGLGTYTSLLPGQCIPVILFVFIEDFTEILPSGNSEEPSETSTNLSTSLNSLARSGLPVKGPGSVVVLARPANKSENGLRKKLQSSLEAQIRFSIKKCRTLSAPESSHAGLKSGVTSSSAPLFSLDASKAVSLVDACACQSGESLEFAISLVEEVLDGKATPDSLLLDSHQQNSKREDILSLKEFIYRQSDILRGRSGLIATTNSGSGSVGMVAVAAAAAAASAASRKMVNAPELPSLEIWSSSSQQILHGILSAKQAGMNEAETNLKNAPPIENVGSSAPLESVVSYLENGIGMTTRFSTLWCEKAFPVAREVYLNNLPPCYPSSQHEDHLKKALLSLTSTAKGPAVQLYLQKLKDECMSIWSSGRQQCDAVSLTGKPCIHQRHDETIALPADDTKHHSSGFVYLHACACGRSRSLRQDPFDYETTNVGFNVFADCDKLLPTAQFPEWSIKGPIQSSHWNLVRIGGARYYDPSKGLLQSGFCATQKFLLRWTIFEKLNERNHSLLNEYQQHASECKTSVDTVVDADNKISHAVRVTAGGMQNGIDTQVGPTPDISQTSSKAMSLPRGLSNFTMKKPFSEVVAGPAATNSSFPPLFSRKQLLQDVDRSVKLHHPGHQGMEKSGEILHNEESQKPENTSSIDKALIDNGVSGDKYKDGDPFLHIGSNAVPLNMTGEQIKTANTMKHVTTYVGFEHECPQGHRFILTLDHLNELGSSYAVPEETTDTLSVENLDRKQDHAKFGKFGGQGRTRRQSNATMVGGDVSKIKNLDKLKEKVVNGNTHSNKTMQSTRQRKDQNGRLKVSHSAKDLESNLKTVAMDDGDCVFSFLNRSLPIYMNCPHCGDSMAKNHTSNIKFASTISQLQRIFVVTPSFPILLAADPIIQFEVACLPSSVPDREQKLQFSLGCPVVLPPESFISLRLPFVYGVKLDDGSLLSLKPFEHQPQLTAWILKGTSLQVVSQKSNLDLGAAT